LFHEIDLDKDGWITYEDYFAFLKEYFGSLSSSGSDQKVPEPVKPSPPP
jgi:Ca2+-binding EF-hand superfamily protein